MGGNKGKVKPRDKPKKPVQWVQCDGCRSLGRAMQVDAALALCEGCGKYVCEKCDVHMPWGKHPLQAHWEDE